MNWWALASYAAATILGTGGLVVAGVALRDAWDVFVRGTDGEDQDKC